MSLFLSPANYYYYSPSRKSSPSTVILESYYLVGTLLSAIEAARVFLEILALPEIS